MVKRLLRLPVVKDRTGSNTNQIYEGMKEGTFPKSVPIGKQTVGWVEEEVDAWIESRIAARQLQPRFRGGPGRGHKGPSLNRQQDDEAAA
jgi:prophage regulatory protein